mmetsp:Transcript_2975/g.11428  ORF Transcript_2975/g.11428 Transcript_2975/m.11428 type:complete len:204 (-) Transcript_2975:5809-6420(-)
MMASSMLTVRSSALFCLDSAEPTRSCRSTMAWRRPRVSIEASALPLAVPASALPPTRPRSSRRSSSRSRVRRSSRTANDSVSESRSSPSFRIRDSRSIASSRRTASARTRAPTRCSMASRSRVSFFMPLFTSSISWRSPCSAFMRCCSVHSRRSAPSAMRAASCAASAFRSEHSLRSSSRDTTMDCSTSKEALCRCVVSVIPA